MRLTIRAFSQALSGPDFAIPKVIKKIGYYCFPMLSIQIKMKKNMDYQELVGFEPTT